MPWILCGPGLSGSPASFWVMTGLCAGSTATEWRGLPARLLPVAGDAGDGAAGADAGDEDVHLAAGVLPDLRARGRLVDGGVGGVLELLQEHVAARVRGDDGLGAGDGAVHPLGALGEDELGAVGDEQLAPLHAHGVGHGERERVAARRRDERQRDAGVAARRLDQLLAGAEHAALLGVPDHGGADAALDRVGGVAPLDLGEDGRPPTVGDAVEAHERRAADGLSVVFEPAGHGASVASAPASAPGRRLGEARPTEGTPARYSSRARSGSMTSRVDDGYQPAGGPSIQADEPGGGRRGRKGAPAGALTGRRSRRRRRRRCSSPS